MRQTVITFFMILVLKISFAQNNDSYFPPINDDYWETISTESLGWNPDSIQSLLNWLEEKDSKGFIILHKGKIAVEHYFDQFTKDSLWYWASAGKSLTATMVGIAQQNDLLNISHKVSDYLGEGWTSCTKVQEDRITLWHQLTMTTGLNTNDVNLDCIDPECLKYMKDAGTRWFYHNAPYRLLQDVLANASGKNFTIYTYNELGKKIGMGGMWYNYIRIGTARDMARYGLFILNRGSWNGDQLINEEFYSQMINTSQNLNPSYGYLWWLNGKGSYVQPGLAWTFDGNIVPSAPNEMFMAAGKNEQRIYILPSRDLVVVRIGNTAINGALALSEFDNQIWEHVMNSIEPLSSIYKLDDRSDFVWYCSDERTLHIEKTLSVFSFSLYTIQGQKLITKKALNVRHVNVSNVPNGTYFCVITTRNGIQTQKIRIQ